jgi:hypothetical protein
LGCGYYALREVVNKQLVEKRRRSPYVKSVLRQIEGTGAVPREFIAELKQNHDQGIGRRFPAEGQRRCSNLLASASRSAA